MTSQQAFVHPNAKIGKDVTIHPFAYIDDNVEIGDNCEIFPFASILSGTRMGKNNKVYQGAIVAASPQDFRWNGEPTLCIIGDDNTIREQVIINRSIHADGATRIGSGNFLMAGTHIGHDSVIEGPCVLGNGVTIAGDVVVEKCCVLSSNAVVHEGSRIGQWSLVKGGCRIGGNVPPYIIVAHNPSTYYGINAQIMRKKGFTDAQIEAAARSYRHIYQAQTSVFNALKRIEADVEDSEIRRSITDFIRNNDMRIVGIKIKTDD